MPCAFLVGALFGLLYIVFKTSDKEILRGICAFGCFISWAFFFVIQDFLPDTPRRWFKRIKRLKAKGFTDAELREIIPPLNVRRKGIVNFKQFSEFLIRNGKKAPKERIGIYPPPLDGESIFWKGTNLAFVYKKFVFWVIPQTLYYNPSDEVYSELREQCFLQAYDGLQFMVVEINGDIIYRSIFKDDNEQIFEFKNSIPKYEELMNALEDLIDVEPQ